eukprot:gene18665-22285_t
MAISTLSALKQPVAALSIDEFSHGQSNPTYLVEVKAAGLEASLQFHINRITGRTIPAGDTLRSTFKVLAALGKVTTNTGGKIPVPRVVCLCTDSSVIVGSVLADIHSVDPAAAGLGDFGKVDNYAERQGKSDFMEQLAQWLQANIPQTQPRGSIIHGDYRLDNMVFEGNSTQVLAVLDWELSTLGDPLADVSYCCMPYQTMPGMPALAGLDMENLSEGIPTESQFVAQYCTRPFYVALSLFRAAAISAGVHRRSVDGN